MKTMMTFILLSLSVSLAAFAQESDATAKRYQCIADKMQAINSDIYYDLQPSDIDTMLQIPEMYGHIDAVRSAAACDKELN